ncbi:hypothetical protein ABND12_12740 [Paenibacillus larvae]
MENKNTVIAKLDVDVRLLEQKLTKIENQLDRILIKLDKAKQHAENKC